MGWMTAAAIVGSSLIGADAAGDAASAQAGASAASTAAQERMFNKQVELQAPFREAGLTAQNKLMSLLGLSPTGAKTYEQYRQEMLPQFTTYTGPNRTYTNLQQLLQAASKPGENRTFTNMRDALAAAEANANVVDENALNKAIQQRMQAEGSAPDFGKYTRDFSMADFQADPGYAFRLSEGQKALERSAAARGGLISGSALKAATRYGQEAGSQEYTNAFNRYQTNRANQLQPLQSLAGVGQTATNTLTGAAGNLDAAQGANLINAGNAAAAGYVGQANAINQGLSTYMNYNQNQGLLNALNNNRGYGAPTGYSTVVADPYGYQG